jgi:hypothetical protein
MSAIKGYAVRMWTSDQKIHSEKFFTSDELLQSRREAFAYADNLLDIMEEAKKAGVISYANPEEILNPDVRIEDVVIGSVHVTVIYETDNDGIISTEEDLIYLPVPDEGSTVEIPLDEYRMLQLLRLETIDLTDSETIRIHNKEAEFYLTQGLHEGIVYLTVGDKSLFLLMDDFVRLKNKDIITVEEMGTSAKEEV